MSWLRMGLLLGATVLVTAGCPEAGPQAHAPKKRQRPHVKITPVEVRALTERLALTGSIEPTRIARMASPVDGPVIACPVREGDSVRPGQLLSRLGRAKGDDALATSAKAELDREELELDRVGKLVATGALPGEELDKARVRVSEAQARHARALERLGDYRVSAPWAGVVSKVRVAVGDFVAAHQTLVELFDPASLVLRFAVPEDCAARVRDGAPIQVTLDAHPGQTFTAAVGRIFPDIDHRSHTRTVEASIGGQAELAPGMFARLQLTLATAPDALAVPVEAVLRREGGPVVFVITDDGTARRRKVELGIQADGVVQLISGARAGERVAIAGHNRLRDGKQVRVAAGGKAGQDGERSADKPGRGKAK